MHSTAQHLLPAGHIASDFTCVYCAAAGTIFGTTDVYKFGFSYLSFGIFIGQYNVKYFVLYTLLKVFQKHFCTEIFSARLIIQKNYIFNKFSSWLRKSDVNIWPRKFILQNLLYLLYSMLSNVNFLKVATSVLKISTLWYVVQ